MHNDKVGGWGGRKKKGKKDKNLPDGFFVVHKSFIELALLLEDRCQI
jgi:hypothetical protein